MELEDQIMKGTTTVAVLCDGGVVLATERRATMGTLIASKTAKKVNQISDTIGMTIAGGVGDAQSLIRILRVESSLYKIRNKRSINIESISTFLANVLQNHKMYPFMVQLILGGRDEDGFHIYSIDAYGGIGDEKDITATGSGSPVAYGVLEDGYYENMSCDEGLKLAVRAISSAIKRDSASGESIDAVLITKDGYMPVDSSTILELSKSKRGGND